MSPEQAAMKERRKDPRVASNVILEAVEVDVHGQPVVELGCARLVNLSAGGVAMTSDRPVDPSSRLRIRELSAAAMRPWIELEALSSEAVRSGLYRVHCRLQRGRIPAKWIIHWSHG